jgi:N-methylhydantoinase A
MREFQDSGEPLHAWLDEAYADLAERAVGEMMAEGFSTELIQQKRSLDLRYVGQSHELTIPFAEGDLVQAFHGAHELRFGYHRSGARVEIVTLRLSVVVPRKEPPIQELLSSSADVETAVVGTKQVWFRGDKMRATLYDRPKLQFGHQFAGPAVVFQYDTTTVVPPAWQASVDQIGNLILSNPGQSHPEAN